MSIEGVSVARSASTPPPQTRGAPVVARHTSATGRPGIRCYPGPASASPLVVMIVGIDLGTTNSLVGIFRDGKPELIPNAFGDLATPSAISLDEQGHTLVGLAARERASTHPQLTVQAFKRW